MSDLLDNVRAKIRTRHLSPSTEKLYVMWVRRYVRFHFHRLGDWEMVHPSKMGTDEVKQFLTHLAVERHVSGSTQNQALSALLFLYKEVLHVRLGNLEDVRAKRDSRIPEVLTADEVKDVLSRLNGVYEIIGQVLYGSGLRLNECVTMRVKDIDLVRKTATARDTKWNKDRMTCIPGSIIPSLRLHLKTVYARWEMNASQGGFCVDLPCALSRKYPNAGTEWAWQYVFPGSDQRRYISPSSVQKAVREAGKHLPKRVSPHILRHSFATHLSDQGVPVQKIQKLLGHKHLKTTMHYVHMAECVDVCSPLDVIRNHSG